MTHVCVSKIVIIGSDIGLSPGRRQAITWTNVGILWMRLLGINCSKIFIEINTFSFKKMHFKMSSAKWRPSCLGLNVLGDWTVTQLLRTMHRKWYANDMHKISALPCMDWFWSILPIFFGATLTHWGRDTMDAISQTIYSNAFSWMKMFEFRLKFHWSLFPRAQLTIFQHWFR